MHIDKSILIKAAPASVMRWLAPHRQPVWDPSLVRATALHEGHFERVARAFGHRFESHAVATFDSGHFSWRQLAGDYEEHTGAFLLEATAGGTRVHLVADVEFPYVMPEIVTEAEIRRRVSDETDEALLRLKEVAERARGAS